MTVAIVGGGQLGRMLALAGYPLGVRSVLLDPAADACAGQVAPLLVGAYDDPDRLAELAAQAEVATYEFEDVPAAAVDALAQAGVPVRPPPAALAAAQDRLAEKRLLGELGIATAPWAQVDDRAGLDRALDRIGPPALLKTRRFGYDGKGQARIDHPDDADAAWQALGGRPLLLEGVVPFDRELSLLAARGLDGTVACYPLVENHHLGGILRLSLAPAPGLDDALRAHGEELGRRLLERLGYVGVLAVELFEVDGALLANELAPRVHNSGHWTIEGAQTSQFEQHLRAVLGLPLGSPAPRGASAMVNLIGELPDRAAVLAVPGAHLHLYGKQARAGRKLGHVTLVAAEPAALDAGLAQLAALVPPLAETLSRKQRPQGRGRLARR